MKVKTMGAAMLAGAMIVGCGVKDDADSASDSVAVSVNGAKLMQSTIDADVAKMVEVQGSRIPADQMEYAKKMMANQVAQSFIIENVLVAKAKAEGFAVTDADRKDRESEFLKAVAKMPDAPKTIEEYFKKFPLGEDRARKEFELGIVIDKMIKSYRSKQQPTKDYSAEAQKIIDNIVSNNAKAVVAETDALKRINELKADLSKVAAGDVAKTFAEMAKKHSSCPSAQKGGDLGEFTHGQMVPEFDKVAFSLPVGKVSDPVKTQFGYHLILVTKKTPAVAAKDDKPAEPEKVAASHILIKSQSKQDVPKKEDVVKYLSKQDERSFVQDFVAAEVKKAKIEAADEYKHLIPQTDEKPVASAATNGKKDAKPAAVETPAKK